MSATTSQLFLVERYAPPGEMSLLREKLKKPLRGTARHLWSVYLPVEQTVFSFYSGETAEDIGDANAAAGLAFEQVVGALFLTPVVKLWPGEGGGSAAQEVIP